jgi:hypothetical protein
VRDVRELILARLLTVVAGVSEIAGTDRNRFMLPDAKLPGISILDGNERAVQTAIGRGLENTPPLKFVLQPQIWVLLKPRKNYENTGVGEELSKFRNRVIVAVLYDETLRGLVNGFDGNGDIEYRGHETDMQSGGAFLGQMRLDFSFAYTLNPADLKES